jgi:hypothetical protein
MVLQSKIWCHLVTDMVLQSNGYGVTEYRTWYIVADTVRE